MYEVYVHIYLGMTRERQRSPALSRNSEPGLAVRRERVCEPRDAVFRRAKDLEPRLPNIKIREHVKQKGMSERERGCSRGLTEGATCWRMAGGWSGSERYSYDRSADGEGEEEGEGGGKGGVLRSPP